MLVVFRVGSHSFIGLVVLCWLSFRCVGYPSVGTLLVVILVRVLAEALGISLCWLLFHVDIPLLLSSLLGVVTDSDIILVAGEFFFLSSLCLAGSSPM